MSDTDTAYRNALHDIAENARKIANAALGIAFVADGMADSKPEDDER